MASNNAADEARIKQKRAMYKDYFSKNIFYLDIQDSYEKRYLEKELKTLFATRIETFLSNRVSAIVTDVNGGGVGSKENIAGNNSTLGPSVKRLPLPNVRNALAKYFGRPQTIPSNVNRGNGNHSRNNINSNSFGLESSTKPDLVEFKGPYLLVLDALNLHKPLHKEFTQQITLEGSRKPHPHLVQLPFVGLSFNAPAHVGGTPFYHNYPKLPFQIHANASKQSLLQSMQKERHELLRSLYLPLITPWTDELEKCSGDVPGISSKTRAAFTKQKDKNDARAKFIESVKQKENVAREMLRLRKESHPYPIYKPLKAPAETKVVEGFCECCYKKFTNLKEHLKEQEHVNFVKNDTNFHDLDYLLATCKRDLLPSTAKIVLESLDGKEHEEDVNEISECYKIAAFGSMSCHRNLKMRNVMNLIETATEECERCGEFEEYCYCSDGESYQGQDLYCVYCDEKECTCEEEEKSLYCVYCDEKECTCEDETNREPDSGERETESEHVEDEDESQAAIDEMDSVNESQNELDELHSGSGHMKSDAIITPCTVGPTRASKFEKAELKRKFDDLGKENKDDNPFVMNIKENAKTINLSLDKLEDRCREDILKSWKTTKSSGELGLEEDKKMEEGRASKSSVNKVIDDSEVKNPLATVLDDDDDTLSSIPDCSSSPIENIPKKRRLSKNV